MNRHLTISPAKNAGRVRAMRLYTPQVSKIAHEVVRVLVAAGQDGGIESEDPKEVERDVAAVLTSYLDMERQVGELARELLTRTNRSQGEYQKVREQIAESKGIKVGDETLDYLLDQVVAMLMHSSHVEEVYAEDIMLRRRMTPIFKKHMQADSDVDTEVRAQLKHLKEGTPAWEIEYSRALEAVKRRRGLG
jgi:hypothetical protein